MDGNSKRMMVILGFLGTGEGILLGRGLELCFGIGQYLLIMLFGVLGGVGIALMIWMGLRTWEADRGSARSRETAFGLSAAGGIPAVLVFGTYFVWRIVPLIEEEIKFSR